MAAHLSMAYVNAVAFGALLLSVSNLIAGTLCAVAIGLIAMLREAVLARDAQPRTCRSQPAPRARARGRTKRGAARTSRA